jgi:hypothetical protein
MVVIIGTGGLHKKMRTALHWKKPKPFFMLLTLVTFEVDRTTMQTLMAIFTLHILQ